MNLVLYQRYTFGSVDLVWYSGFGKLDLVPSKVRLYQLSKPKTSFAFHTIKMGLAMVEISPMNIVANHG